MGHYIEAGGDFERAAKALLADGWTVPYVAVSDPPKIGVKCKYTFGVRLVAGAGCWEQVWEPRLELRAGRYGVLVLSPVIQDNEMVGYADCGEPCGIGGSAVGKS